MHPTPTALLELEIARRHAELRADAAVASRPARRDRTRRVGGHVVARPIGRLALRG